MDAFHERLAQLALRAGSGLGFALAGGYAVQAHGFLTRPSEDVDLFTSAERTDFRDGVNTIKSGYEKQGIAVRVDVCSDHFARLWVTDTHSDQSGKVELAADIRSKAPVTMSIGPVVHVDDFAGGKMGRFSPAPRRGTSLTLTRSSLAAGSPGPGCKNSPPAETLASISEFSPTCSQ